MINHIPVWYPVIAGVLATTVAFGMGFQKIETLEEAMIEQTVQAEKIENIKASQAAFDARQMMIIDMLKTIQQDLKDVKDK